MIPELVETYLSAIAADHVHDIDYGHPYDVVRDLGRAAVAHLDGEVPKRDSFGDLTVSASSLCMGEDMWETVLEAADAIRSQHAALRGTTTESDLGPVRDWSELDEDRLAALANQIRRAAYAWLITRDLVVEGVCGQRLLEQAGVAADVALGHAPRGQHSPETLHQAAQVESLFGEFFDLMESAALAGLRSINARRSTHVGDSGGQMEAPDQPPTLEELIEWCHRPMRCADLPDEWARMWLGTALENHDGLGAIAALRDLGWSAEHIADDPSRVPYPWCRVLVEQVHRMVAADIGIPYPEPPDEDIEWLVEGCDYVDPESFFMIRSAVLTMARLCSGERATELVRHLHD